MKWATYTMQELINEISMGPFGSDIKKSVYTNSGVPVLNGSNLQGFTLKENTFGYVSEEKADSLKKCNAHRGDIIVTHRGTLGQIVYIPNNSLFERYVISQSQFRFNLKPELARAEFIVYYFHTREGQHKILSNASQVGVPALARATTTFRQLEVKVPPLPVQDKIVGILSALDSKIENNNKINANLEAQAEALFKSWFVDFTPFKDQPFVDSELGPIPPGWKVGKLGDYCECVLGGTPSRSESSYWNGDIAWINSGEVNKFRICTPSEFITSKGLDNSSTKLLPKKTTVLAITGATLGQISILEIDSCANQSVIGIKQNDNMPYEFIYPTVKVNIKRLLNLQTGGAQQHINKNNVQNLFIVYPPKFILQKYKEHTKCIYSKISTLCFENQRLAALRDTLLPKLMSGEIKL